MSRWPLISYTDALPDGVAGDARGPFIRIRCGYEADEGLYQHELRHVKQWALVGLVLAILNAAAAWILAPVGILTPLQAACAMGFAALVAGHGVLYLTLAEYRQAAEIDAYRTQMRFPNSAGGFMSLESAARRLAKPRYKLGIDTDQAAQLLRG